MLLRQYQRVNHRFPATLHLSSATQSSVCVAELKDVSASGICLRVSGSGHTFEVEGRVQGNVEKHDPAHKKKPLIVRVYGRIARVVKDGEDLYELAIRFNRPFLDLVNAVNSYTRVELWIGGCTLLDPGPSLEELGRLELGRESDVGFGVFSPFAGVS